MGSSRSAAELAGKFGRLAAEVPRANRDAVNASAFLGKQIMEQGAARAGLRKGGRLAGAKWGARYDIKGADNPTALLRYTGPVHWAFFGTRPHIIGARRRATRAAWRRRYANSVAYGLVGATGGRGGRARTLQSGRYGERGGKGALALRFGGRFAMYATHPGTKGNNTWPQTKARIVKAAPREFQRAHREAVKRARF
jgi:hypothetical protein